MPPFDDATPEGMEHQPSEVIRLMDEPALAETDGGWTDSDDLELFNHENLNRLLFAITCSTRPFLVCSALLQSRDGSEFTYRATAEEDVQQFVTRLSTEAGYRKAVAAFFVLTTQVGIKSFLAGGDELTSDNFENVVVTSAQDAPVPMQPGIYWMSEVYGVGAIHGVIALDTAADDPAIKTIATRQGAAEGMPFHILNMTEPA